MADENLETIADLLIEGIRPYDPATRRRDAQRLIRLNDGKEIIRNCARFIDASTPGIWQLIFADALDYAGRALLAFTGGVKKLVKKAGFFEALAALLFNVDIALQPVARKFALFFGQRTAEVIGGPWRKILAYFLPVSTGTVKKEAVLLFFDVLHARRIAKLVNDSCVYLVENSTADRRYRIHKVLPQTKHNRRRRKTVRSRKHG
jgi:hypothetical protein